MAIADYLTGIQRATTGEKTDLSNAAKDLSTLQEGSGNLVTKLKDALNTKLNNNKDIIEQQADTMGNYFNAGPTARAKYQDVFNPFQKAELVQKERTMALRPYDVLSGVLENRMGTVNDIVQSGIQGWQGLMDAAGTKLDLAKTNMATALQAYLAASGQQEAADQLGLEIAKAKEASRQFNISSAQEDTKIKNQESQFAQDLAARLKIAGMSAGGGVSTSDKNANNTLSAWQQALAAGTDVAGNVNEWKVWNYINQNKDMLGKAGVNVSDLWNAHSALKASTTPATTAAPAGKNYFGQAASWIGDYFNPNSEKELNSWGMYLPKR